jgi:ATP-dependent protease ClpP protease subunit
MSAIEALKYGLIDKVITKKESYWKLSFFNL